MILLIGLGLGLVLTLGLVMYSAGTIPMKEHQRMKREMRR